MFYHFAFHVSLWSILCFIFAYDEVEIHLHSFACGDLVIPAPITEKTILCPWNCLEILVKNQLIINIRLYFCTLNFISMICMCIFMQIPHCLDYYRFMVSFEIRKCESSNCVLFQDCFSYSVSLGLMQNKKYFKVSQQNRPGILLR